MSDPAAAPAAPSAPTPVASAAAALLNTPAPAAPAPAPAADTAPAAPAAPAGDPPADPPAEPVLKMPGKDATPEDWAAFYNALGRPETPEAYELPVPEGDDGSFVKDIAPMLHKNGLTAEQAKGLAADWNGYVAKLQADADAAEASRVAALNAQNTAEATALQNEWGARHTENMELARRAVQQFMPGEKAGPAIAALESVLGYKGTIQFLHGIGKGLGEGDAAGLGNSNAAPTAKTLAERMYPNMKP